MCGSGESGGGVEAVGNGRTHLLADGLVTAGVSFALWPAASGMPKRLPELWIGTAADFEVPDRLSALCSTTNRLARR